MNFGLAANAVSAEDFRCFFMLLEREKCIRYIYIYICVCVCVCVFMTWHSEQNFVEHVGIDL